jgi:hypothetical protein
MKVSSFSKFALLSLLVGVLALALTGCGSSSSNNLALTPGNWSVTATSTSAGVIVHNNVHRDVESGNIFYIGGNLAQTGSSVAGTMYAVGSCIDSSQAITFTGTVEGNNVTLTSASAGGQVVTLKATGTASTAGAAVSALTGTYTVTGGCDDGDSGTATANAVPSISGTWSGPIQDSFDDPNAVLSVALTQASTASSDGTFALTGTVTYTNSSCSASGTITSGSIAGSYVMVNASTVDQDGEQGSFSYTEVQLDSTTAPKNMTGSYYVNEGYCADDNYTTTLTKQ